MNVCLLFPHVPLNSKPVTSQESLYWHQPKLLLLRWAKYVSRSIFWSDNSGAKLLFLIKPYGFGAHLSWLADAGFGGMVVASVKKGKPELRSVQLSIVLRLLAQISIFDQRKAWRRRDGCLPLLWDAFFFSVYNAVHPDWDFCSRTTLMSILVHISSGSHPGTPNVYGKLKESNG